MNDKVIAVTKRICLLLTCLTVIIILFSACTSFGFSIRYGIKAVSLGDTGAVFQPPLSPGRMEYLIAPVGAAVLPVDSVTLSGDGVLIIDGREINPDTGFVLDNLAYGENLRQWKVVYPDNTELIYNLKIYRSLPVIPEFSAGEAPEPAEARFLVNPDGTVSDLVTGLIWLQDPSLCERAPWEEAFVKIRGLNDAALAGRRDWRLPTITELRTLVNHGVPNGAAWLNTMGFLNVSGPYWNSTTHVTDAAYAYTGCFVYNHASHAPRKALPVAIWPVCSRGAVASSGAVPAEGYVHVSGEDGNPVQGVAWPAPRFCDNGDGTVTDNMTGLMWIKNASVSGRLNYEAAGEWMRKFNAGETEVSTPYSDWSIPSVAEVQTLVNIGVEDTAEWLENCEPGFDNVGSFYWTRNSFLRSSVRDENWIVSMQAGIACEFGLVREIFCWPVRRVN